MTTTRDKIAAATLITLIAAASVGCCVASTLHPSPMRSPAQQHNADVRVMVYCVDAQGKPVLTADGKVTGQYGSGVAVSPGHVLTAFHVVVCDQGTAAISVDPGDGVPHPAFIEIVLPHSDVITLSVVGPLPDTIGSTVEIGPKPHVGDRVCEAAAYPTWSYRCGTAQPTSKDEPRDSDIKVDFRVEHGNSGSGLYDARGRLIGIMTALEECPGDPKDDGGGVCWGLAASLQDYPWLVGGTPVAGGAL